MFTCSCKSKQIRIKQLMLTVKWESISTKDKLRIIDNRELYFHSKQFTFHLHPPLKKVRWTEWMVYMIFWRSSLIFLFMFISYKEIDPALSNRSTNTAWYINVSKAFKIVDNGLNNGTAVDICDEFCRREL